MSLLLPVPLPRRERVLRAYMRVLPPQIVLTPCLLVLAPGCRDRAAERRKGLNTEFEGVPEDLVGLLAGQVGGAGAPADTLSGSPAQRPSSY